jgi:hypothetical protein
MKKAWCCNGGSPRTAAATERERETFAELPADRRLT